MCLYQVIATPVHYYGYIFIDYYYIVTTMKTKITSASVSKLLPKGKKCTHCDIFLYKVGQKFETHNITAEITYDPLVKSVVKKRKILTDEITGTKDREPTIFNIEGNDGLCRMCELTRKGQEPVATFKELNRELFDKYPVTIKEEIHEPYEMQNIDKFINFEE